MLQIAAQRHGQPHAQGCRPDADTDRERTEALCAVGLLDDRGAPGLAAASTSPAAVGGWVAS
jgi:hypothetical protein